jgi:hypothetical protein
MADEKDDRMLGLSPAQVVGSALAAVSGALLASFAGTTGTIIGTAVGSIVATVGGAVYTWSLKRSSDAVRRTAAQVRQAALLAGPLPRTVAQGPMRPEGDSAGEEGNGAQETPSEAAQAEKERSRRSIPWGKALLASLAVTAVALGGITTFEAVTGQPISSLLGRDDSKGTSVGNFVGTRDETPRDERKPTDEPSTPSEDQSPAPAPDQDPDDPGQEPTEVPETPVPSITPTPDPAVPSDQPSVVPEDGAQGAPGTGSGTEPEAAP